MSLQENIEFYEDSTGCMPEATEYVGRYSITQSVFLSDKRMIEDNKFKQYCKSSLTESIRQRLVSDAMDVGFLDYIVTEEEYRELLMEATDKLLWEEKLRVGPNAPRRVQERIKKLTWLMDTVAKLKVTSPYEASLKYEEIWSRAKENPEVTCDTLTLSCDNCKYMMCNDGGVCCSVISFPDGMPDEFYCGFHSEGECIK